MALWQAEKLSFVCGRAALVGKSRKGFERCGVTFVEDGAEPHAAVYGILGLIVILTAGKLGTIKAKPWLHVANSVVLVVLALAMARVTGMMLVIPFLGRGMVTALARNGVIMALAALMEGLQGFTADRIPDLSTALAGAAGALAGALLTTLLTKLFKRREAAHEPDAAVSAMVARWTEAAQR